MANIQEKMETMTNFISLGSKITVDSDYSNVIKRCMLLGRKAMTNIDSILKKKKKNQRHYFADKGPSSQSYVVVVFFSSVVIYGCESWTIKKSECQKIDVFEMCWRKFLTVP